MSLPLCPTGCTGTPPTVDFSLCNPEINNGQIAHIFMTTIGNPLTNAANVLEWDTRLDNDAAGASKIRALTVIGGKPAPASTEKEISLGRKVTGVKAFTLNFKVDETNQINYDAMRTMECNGNFLFWYQTRDGLLYGGNSGIEGKFLVNEEIPDAYTDLITLTGTITWESKYHPERQVSPILSTTGDQY